MELPHVNGEPMDNNWVHAQPSVYERFDPTRKRIITAITALCGFLAPISTTSVLAAIPELVETFDTTATIMNTSNAVYLAFMALASLIWGPWADSLGRRSAYLFSATMFVVFSGCTAVSPSLELYFLFRGLTAFQATAFLILGSSCISDIYHPTQRGTSLGWFLSGTVVGPAFGPLIGGIIVTFTSWRAIFWFQASLGIIALLAVVFFLPETRHPGTAIVNGNPMKVIKLFSSTNYLIVCLASSSLLWNMYSLLTPIRIVLNSRFQLTTPLQAGLLYIAPGTGYVVGSLIGGRWADYTVKSWIRKRGARRIPEDRLRSSLPFLCILLPMSMLLYGWAVDRRFGSIALPVTCMFIQGVAQLAAFPCLNTYILDSMQSNSGEASAGHYLMRYGVGAIATAACLPIIDSIGVGWLSTISAAVQMFCASLVYWTICYR